MWLLKWIPVVLVVFLALVSGQGTETELFPVHIIHLNDFHARFEETNSRSNLCKPDEGDVCIGGYARVVSKVRQRLDEKKDLNPIYLNAGDNFQGTLWYNIFRWNVTSYFLNLLPADAMTIGNHEFDHNIAGIVPFLESIDSPIVVANIDDSDEPTFQNKYNKSVVIDKYGRKIGIIGVILQTTNNLAATGKLRFYDETETVRAEAAVLKAAGVDIIIVLSHSGIDVDQHIAKNCGSDIDVIVGAHTHTFLYTGDNPPGPDTVKGEYPTIVEQPDGHKVYVVQASAYTKYLGDITFYFDAAGKVVLYEGAPIFLDQSVPKAEDIETLMQPWKEVVDLEGNAAVGLSRVHLSKSDCSKGECNLGSLVTSSFVHAYMDSAEEGSWTYASVALTNGGGIRTDLSTGMLTFAELVATLPFENTLDVFELRGQHLWDTLEFSMSDSYYMLQSAGLRAEFDMSQPVGSRTQRIEVLCHECLVPKYEPIDLAKWYRVIAPSFLANGGDGFDTINDNKRNQTIGPIDIDAFQEFVQLKSPIIYPISGRWKIVN